MSAVLATVVDALVDFVVSLARDDRLHPFQVDVLAGISSDENGA